MFARISAEPIFTGPHRLASPLLHGTAPPLVYGSFQRPSLGVPTSPSVPLPFKRLAIAPTGPGPSFPAAPPAHTLPAPLTTLVSRASVPPFLVFHQPRSLNLARSTAVSQPQIHSIPALYRRYDEAFPLRDLDINESSIISSELCGAPLYRSIRGFNR